ncbi:MAG: ferrous iron transport protein A [Spirulina sp.]
MGQKSQAIALTELQPGMRARVENIADSSENITLRSFSQRLQAMGILRDRPIEVLRRAGFGRPLHIRVGQTTELAIRPQEAQWIMVKVMGKDEGISEG